jgi:hypothetical protein
MKRDKQIMFDFLRVSHDGEEQLLTFVSFVFVSRFILTSYLHYIDFL